MRDASGSRDAWLPFAKLPDRDRLVLDRAGGSVQLMRSGEDTYEVVHEVEFEVVVILDELSPGNAGLHVGWDWWRRDHLLAWLDAEAVGDTRVLEFRAPAQELFLWWSRGSRPGEALRLDEGRVRVRPGRNVVRLP